MNHTLIGFEKAAAAGAIVPKLISGLKSMGAQLASGGSRVAKSGIAAGSNVGKNPMGKDLVYRGADIVKNRMIRRGLWGAGIGAGGSMLQQKMQGEDVSLGRAAAGGVLGAGVGAAFGTTAGARAFRRLTSPKSTPNLTFNRAANPSNWFKKAPDVVTKGTSGGTITSKGQTAWGNMSPLDKGFLVHSGIGLARDVTSPEYEGRRGEAIGSNIGNAAAVLTGSRWKAMRSGRSGSLTKSLGLYTGGSMAGSVIGKQFDRRQEVPGA